MTDINEILISLGVSEEDVVRTNALHSTMKLFFAGDFRARFAKHTERGTALALCADLDNALADRLKRLFIIDGPLLKDAFAERGPFGSIDAKSKTCYLMGALPKVLFDEIQIVTRVRNKFAHHVAVDNFDHPKVAGLIDNLKLAEAVYSCSSDVSANENSISVKSIFDLGGMNLRNRNDLYVATLFVLIGSVKVLKWPPT